MPETGVNYKIQITREGDGAAIAASELKAVEAGFTRTATAARAAQQDVQRMAQATAPVIQQTAVQVASLESSFTRTTTAARSASQQLNTTATRSLRDVAAGGRAVKNALELVAITAFPQAAGAAAAFRVSMEAVKASAVALNAPLSAAGAGIAGLTAIIWAGVEAWKMFTAQALEAKSAAAAFQVEGDLNTKLRSQLNALKDDPQHAVTAEALLARVDELSRSGRFTSQTARPITMEIAAIRAAEQKREVEKPNVDQFRRAMELEKLRLVDPEQAREQERFTQYQNDRYKRLAEIKQWQKDGAITLQESIELQKQSNALWEEQWASINVVTAHVETFAEKWGRVIEDTAAGFSSGLAGAIVDVASGIQEADEAFRQFASNFLRQLAEMIIQTVIFNALKSAAPSVFGASPSAAGGIWPTMAMASGGMVSSATYFPRHNVVAGEAGAEWLTVLARPRLMQIGGINAAVGNAGPARLAVTSADELERRAGGGGLAVIEVRPAAGYEATLVNQAIEGATVRVANDLQRDSQISRGVRRLQ